MSRALETADFDYELPIELIAQNPLHRRDDSRLMVLDRDSGTIHHSMFNRLSDWLVPGDLLVANNSRVIPARLRGNRVPSGGAVEILLLRRRDTGTWSALAKPAKRLKPGDRIELLARVSGTAPAAVTVEENLGDGELLLQFEAGAEERLDALRRGARSAVHQPSPGRCGEIPNGLCECPGVGRRADCRDALHPRDDRRAAPARFRMGRSHASYRTRYVSARH